MRALRFALLFTLAGCGSGVTVPPSTSRDVRVAIPEYDPSFLDFVTPEAVVPPHTEKMFCTDLVYDGEETAFSAVEAVQGKFGHHVVIVTTTEPRPPGETYDCTDRATMAHFRPFAIPTGDLKPGMGTLFHKGTPIVIQSHYVNTGDAPIVIRDVLRLRKMDPTTITTHVAPSTFLNLGFSVPPHAVSTVSFDCTLQSEMSALNFGPHMHEYGKSIEILIGPSVHQLVTELRVDDWRPEYRDDPPVNVYLENPRRLAAGTVIRTTCTWNNTTDRTLEFPEEMCVTFGLMAGPREPVVCTVGGEL